MVSTSMRFLITISVLCLAASLAEGESARPNIVWIFVDDMSANFSCYGEKTIQTPNVPQNWMMIAVDTS